MRQWRRDRGVALVAVLWMVAALSLAAYSLIGALRGEIRHVGNERATLTAASVADGAILLALQDLQVNKQTSLNEVKRYRLNYQDADVDVEVIPLNGWIDLNNAPEPLLQALFQHGGGVPAGQAQQLAQATKAYREIRTALGPAQGFEAPEDLLRVPGVDFDLYVKLERLITAELASGGRVNALAAPVEVLQVLAGGNAGLAGQVASARINAGATTDLTGFPAEYVGSEANTRVCVCARVVLPDGRVLLRGWRVALGASTVSGLPWRILGREQRFVAAAPL